MHNMVETQTEMTSVHTHMYMHGLPTYTHLSYRIATPHVTCALHTRIRTYTPQVHTNTHAHTSIQVKLWIAHVDHNMPRIDC